MHKIILNKPSARIAVVTALVISILLGAWFTVWSPLATSAESSNENSVSNMIWARVEWGSTMPQRYVQVERENVGGETKTYLRYELSLHTWGFGYIPNECLKAKGAGNIVLHIDDTSTIPGTMGNDGSIHVEWNKIPGPWRSVEWHETWHYPDGSIESFSYTETEYPAEAQGTVIYDTLDDIEQAVIQKRQFKEKQINTP